ncbi:MAG: zinc-dependent peptidase [Gemmataceae bacterium]|nr:zinc-dependent peptidase [Gemmataceae bacterium]
MLFSWLRKRRRRRLLAEPFPAAWQSYLEDNFAHYRLLTEAERATLHNDLRVVVAEKEWEGCRGQEMTDEVKVTIAAQACLLVLARPHNYFVRVVSILVYPRSFRIPGHEVLGNVVLEGDMGADGQADRTTVVLSWEDVVEDGRRPRRGRNVVYHEFAHQLDFEDGEINGAPHLDTPDLARRWQTVMTGEYNRLCEAIDTGEEVLLDEYAATDPGEFFAVATEYFFSTPRRLQHYHPELYDLFRDYYRQDPAARHGRGEWG